MARFPATLSAADTRNSIEGTAIAGKPCTNLRVRTIDPWNWLTSTTDRPSATEQASFGSRSNAVDALKDQRYLGTAWGLADGFAVFDLSLWVGPGSTIGKKYNDSKQSQQSLETSLPFSAQDITLRMDLGNILICIRCFAANQPDPNQYWVDASPPARITPWTGSIACADGKKIRQSAPRPPLGKLWARSTNFWQPSNGLSEIQAWGHRSQGITEHAEDEITRQRPDLQTHPVILGQKDKGDMEWLDMADEMRVEQNMPPLPPGWLDPAK